MTTPNKRKPKTAPIENIQSEATPESTTESTPESPLAGLTPAGRKYFNEVRRLIPFQHDGDPLGDLPIQSR